MKKLSLLCHRCAIFHKRFYFKKGFLALLVFVFLLGLSFGLVSQMDSGMMTVALAAEDDDAVSCALMEKLLSDRGVVRFLQAEDGDDATALVKTGKADAAWIFLSELSQKSDAFAKRQTSRNALVRVVQREDGILQMLLREKLSGVLYPYLSERYYLRFITNTLEKEDVASPSEDVLLGIYRAQAPEGASLFDFQFTDDAKRAGGAILTAPLRGLLSVSVVLCALAVAMFYKSDMQNGVFVGFSRASMPLFAFGYHFCAVFDVGLVMLLSLWAAGMFTSFWSELLYLVLFAAAASLFAMILERICRKLSLLAALTPLLVLCMLVICPVFFTIPTLRVLPNLFPPYYYIMGMSGGMSVWPMIGYLAALCGIYGVLTFLSLEKHSKS